MTEAAPPPPATAAEILTPALQLWLVLELLYGVAVQLSAGLFPLADAQAYTKASGAGWVVIWLLRDLIAAGVVIRFVRHDRDARRIFAPPRPRTIELCLFAMLVGGLLLHMWDTWLLARTGAPPPSWAGAQQGIWLALLTTGLLPGVIEELAFRGLIQQRLLRVLPVRLALPVQAMLFSLMHTDWIMLMPHFAFGLLAGALRVVAGALWPCMLLHVGWNVFCVLNDNGMF